MKNNANFNANQPKIEKLNKSQIKQENKKLILEENKKAFQNDVNILFAELVKKIEEHSDEEIKEFFDSIEDI